MQDLKTIPGLQFIPAEQNTPGVEYIKDVRYITRETGPLYMQIMKPLTIDPDVKFPLVVYIQGSAFRAQELYRWTPQLAAFARRGFVVASVQYRGSETTRFPGPIFDVKAALRYIVQHATEYQADPEKLVIWGDSSGGLCALLVGFTEGTEFLEPGDYANVKPHIKGIIDWYGANDQRAMLQMDPDKVDPEIIDILECQFGKNPMINAPELMASAVAMDYISLEREIPPVQIFHGDVDVTVPFEQSAMLYERLLQCKKEAEFYCVQGAAHAGPAFHAASVTDKMEAFIRRVTQ